MKEIEAKIKISKGEYFRIFDGPFEWTEINQENVFYSLGECFLRIRREVLEEGLEKMSLTYKGPLQKGKLKVREESEVGFTEGYHKLIGIFGAMGFEPDLEYEKYRCKSTIHNCEVCLDLLPNKDRYLEVEGVSEKDVLECLDFLKVESRDFERRSYQDILNAKN
jgi:adenylate cyclase class IV